MAVIAHIVLRGVSTDQYDQVRAEVGWLERTPEGGMAHLAWWEGDDNHNLDAWESEEACNAFGMNQLGPAMAKLGINVQPEMSFYAAHEVFTPRELRVTK